MSLVETSFDSEGLCLLTLNDPDHRNAMSLEMADAFRAAVETLRGNAAKRIVVLTGAGSAFSAGGDLRMLRKKADLTKSKNVAEMLAFYDAFLGLLTLDVPVIAAINGHAIGAGACVAMACDYRIVSETAKIGFTFVRLGLHPGMGATYTLPRIAGAAVASDLLLSGRVVAAAEAGRLGLVHRVVADDQVLRAAEDYAAELQRGGPQALSGLLTTLRPDPDALRVALEREAQQQAENYASAEFLEGIAASLERRLPRFRR